MKWNVKNLEQFESATTELLHMIKTKKSKNSATIVCLKGDLGAGKTTMTQMIGNILHVKEMINSPTFVIKKTYQTNDSDFQYLVHMDAYRLEDEHNLDVLKLTDDFKKPETLMIIEWPEIIDLIIPDNALQITIEHVGEGRVIVMKE